MIHHHTETALAVPAELSETKLDTGKWSVQKGDLYPYSCHHLLAESVFHSGATDLSRSANAKVLLIGLGGGIVNGFLHFHFPKMDITVVEISSKMVYIARKWYGLEFDDHHRVVVKDGVKFVEGEARKGVKYDAVLVDVCDSSPQLIRPIICPIRTFLGEAYIKNTAKIISSEGVAAFNILTKTLTSEELSDLLTPHFSNYFNYCNIKDTGIGNMIFYCMLKRPLKEKNINVLEFVKNIPH